MNDGTPNALARVIPSNYPSTYEVVVNRSVNGYVAVAFPAEDTVHVGLGELEPEIAQWAYHPLPQVRALYHIWAAVRVHEHYAEASSGV